MNKEQIHDAQIYPLMDQVIAICKEHKIAMVASFSIPNDEDEDLHCTTALTTSEFDPSDKLKDCVKILKPVPAPSFMLRTQHADGSQTLTAFLD